MDFGIVSTSESASIMAILNANNFSTSVGVAEIDGANYLETKSSYICFAGYVTKKQYKLFLMGTSIDNRIDRFKFYGKNYAKLPPCLPLNIPSDMQKEEIPDKKDKRFRKPKKGFSTSSWSVTLHPNNPLWKEAKFPIYGFGHYVHYLQRCNETPELCQYYASTNSTNCIW